jgi:hypothetical protein
LCAFLTTTVVIEMRRWWYVLSRGAFRSMKKLRRKPTYGAAIRLARIASELFSKPYGWSFEAIENSLEISGRTLARYVSVLRSDLLDSRGNPIVEVVGTGGARKLRLASSMKAQERCCTFR